jgi:hypothetical protein
VSFASLFAAVCPFAAAATLSGQVVLGTAPLANVLVLGPNANCTKTDSAGNFSCTVATPWSGSLAAYADGYAFAPASRSFARLTANQANLNFTASPAYGLRSELAVYRPSTRQTFIDYDYNSQPEKVFAFGAPGDIELAGDVNGDGITDIVLFRDGLWYADVDQDGHADLGFAFGMAGDRPLLADVDGDGTADLIVFRSGTWYVSTQRNGVADRIYHFGASGDVPLAADFNGDGMADLAVYRDGLWFVDTNRDAIADVGAAFGGGPSDIPVVVDYDGDGRADLGVFRDGTWYFSGTQDGKVSAIAFYGTSGDRPLGGFFNRANTLFVRAGAGCTIGCTQANPYGSIYAAWQAAVSGQIIRIAKGTYPESMVFTYPGNQYAPGKFGKNDIKLIGVSKNAVTISPAAGDAIELQGSTGYFLRGLRLQTQQAGRRGLVLAGGPGSYVASFPGAQVNVSVSDIMENHGQNVLLTGTANAWIRYARLNRSRASHGLSAWTYSFARVFASEVSANGYTVAAGTSPPDAGKGLDARESSEIDARRSTIRDNLTFGVIGINSSKVTLLNNTIERSGYNGVIFCGVASPDLTQTNLNGNWISSNGWADPQSGYNGVEYYATCAASHQLVNNTLVANTLNGAFVGSGTVTMTGNTFLQNRIGLTLFANDGINASQPSAADTVVTLYGNLFKSNALTGIFAQRYLSTSVKQIDATIGGGSAGQKNTLRDHTGGAFHAISCLNVSTQFVCPSGGNIFVNNNDDIEATCPATCVQ